MILEVDYSVVERMGGDVLDDGIRLLLDGLDLRSLMRDHLSQFDYINMFDMLTESVRIPAAVYHGTS